MHGRPVGNADITDPLQEVWPLLLRAAHLVVPSTLLASLFYYFGLRYTDDHYRQYGLDDAALGYSSMDYIVRSLNVTVQPARVVAIGVVVAMFIHVTVATVLHAIDQGRPRAHLSPTRIIGAVLIAVGLTGSLEFWSRGRVTTNQVHLTGGWLISVLVLTYGAYLACCHAPHSHGTSNISGGAFDRRERRVITSVVVAMLLVLTAQGAFDFTRAYARDRAYRESLRIEANPWGFPLVRIYSTIDLALDDQLEVPESDLGTPDGGFRYRYDHLRLFIQDNGRIVLWPAEQSPRAGMFILTESADLRVEYLPQRHI